MIFYIGFESYDEALARVNRRMVYFKDVCIISSKFGRQFMKYGDESEIIWLKYLIVHRLHYIFPL